MIHVNKQSGSADHNRNRLELETAIIFWERASKRDSDRDRIHVSDV